MVAVPQGAIDGGVAALRAHLRLGAGEDAALRALVASAVAVGEAFTGAAFIVRAHEDLVPASGAWAPLAAGPVRSITGATGLRQAGAPFVMPVESYGYDIEADGRGWVRVLEGNGADRVAVQYSAGLAATWDELPAGIQHGVVALAAHLHDDRNRGAAPPAAVTALWRPHRRMRLAEMRA